MLGRFENALLVLAAIAVFVMGAMITVNVVLRLFGTSLPDGVVIVRELMVVAIVLPLAVVTRMREHISVEVITNLMPENAVRLLVILGWAIGLFAMGVLAFAGMREFLSAWASGSFYFGDLSLPKWPGRLAFAIGMLAVVIRLLLVVRDDIRSKTSA